jgi:hypothetical protein
MSRLDDFDVVIRHRGGKIVAGIPQLSLYATGDDFNTAMAALDAKKNALAADLEDAGELDILQIEARPGASLRGAEIDRSGDLVRFAIKSGITVFAVVMACALSAMFIDQKVEKAVDGVKGIKIGGARFWSQAERDVDWLASPDSDLPEQTKKKLLADIRAIVIRWRPFVVEIQSALASPDNSAPPANK